jgi:hypothetical protein
MGGRGGGRGGGYGGFNSDKVNAANLSPPQMYSTAPPALKVELGIAFSTSGAAHSPAQRITVDFATSQAEDSVWIHEGADNAVLPSTLNVVMVCAVLQVYNGRSARRATKRLTIDYCSTAMRHLEVRGVV